jgi:hypothetical protein
LEVYLPASEEVSMVMDKVRMNRLRRVAKRRGFEVRLSRRRDPLAVDYGTVELLKNGRRLISGSIVKVEKALDNPDALAVGATVIEAADAGIGTLSKAAVERRLKENRRTMKGKK